MYKGEPLATGMNNNLGNLKMFDQAWEETLNALEKELERDPLEALYHRHLAESTLMWTAFAVCRIKVIAKSRSVTRS